VLGKIHLVYEAESWAIDTIRRELRARGAAVPLGARAFEILETLVKSAGELVTKDELMAQIWPGAIIGENTLQVHISAIRKVLGPDRAMLKTVSGRGYRLLGAWHIRSHDSAASVVDRRTRQAAAPPATNIPSALTNLVGRSDALELLRALATAYRQVTLTGPGGIGKTVLAIEVARRIVAEFEDGGFIVELASVSDPSLVPSAVAQALGLTLSGGAITPEAVALAIGNSNLLLVLDNSEHVVETTARLTEAIIRRCRGTTVIVTSREALRNDGEYIFRVSPLEIPPSEHEPPENLLTRSAVELFVARVRALDADFAPSRAEFSAVAAICRHLDGIPLAIEFAAARTVTLGLEQVAVGLRDRFSLLTTGRRTALARHRTLRAALDWSYELLPAAECQLLRCLAIFAGGFTLGAAVAVTQGTGLDAAGVMEGTGNLVAKSLITLDRSGRGSRWYMLETIRAYAFEKLTRHDEFAAVARRHAAYFCDLFEPALQLTQEELTSRIREIDNVRAALDWSFAPEGNPATGVALTAAYAPVWLHQSLVAECISRCETALEALDPNGEQSLRYKLDLQISLGFAFLETMGPPASTRALLTEALEIADKLNDLEGKACALWGLWLAIGRHQHGSALPMAERMFEIAHELGYPAATVSANYTLGFSLTLAGHLKEGRIALERAVQQEVPPPDRHHVIYYRSGDGLAARAMLARTLCIQGLADQAQREAEACLEISGETSDHGLICRVVYNGACPVAFLVGDLAVAEYSIARMNEAATGLNASFWKMQGRTMEARLMIERSEFAKGLANMRDAFAEVEHTGWPYPKFEDAFALAHAGLGQIDKALEIINKAVAVADKRPFSSWNFPELLRVRGELLLQQEAEGFIQATEDCFGHAATMAHEQGALLWELRIALSLVRLRLKQSRASDARNILAPVYGRFTEGFAIADMQTARALLDSLPGHPS
jgi:predicted ATPase/DNA-binding winged helix-turn-helix (wHTH) protein